MTKFIKYFTVNTLGVDYVVGDIHGHFTKLSQCLKALDFEPAVDRLFSVGDLVDRGPESDAATEWLEFPWFHAVMGNHEDMAIRWPRGNMDQHNYNANGGGWNIMNPPCRQQEISDALADLPLCIHLETNYGNVAIVHADLPAYDWAEFESLAMQYEAIQSSTRRQNFMDSCMWNRGRVEQGNHTPVKGVHTVVVGHTPMDAPTLLGNVLHIDTAGWHPRGAGFTFFNVRTRECLNIT